MRILLLVLVLLGGFWLWKEIVEVEEVADVDEEPGRQVAPTEFVSEAGVVLRVTSPMQDSVITSPFTITGEAPGTWYFEASFPIVIVDWDGLIIAQGHAEAQADWMTEAFVPFVGTVEFVKPAYGENGMLILQRDNPSGLPQNDDAVEIPIRFK